jgi:hypothetical protein
MAYDSAAKLAWPIINPLRVASSVSYMASWAWKPRDTPLWKLEASLKCRSCRKGRYAPPVHMIKLTEKQEIAPYKWVRPDEER